MIYGTEWIVLSCCAGRSALLVVVPRIAAPGGTDEGIHPTKCDRVTMLRTEYRSSRCEKVMIEMLRCALNDGMNCIFDYINATL